MRTREFPRVALANLLALSLVPPLWVFLRSWNDFTGYSLPYLFGGVIANTFLEVAALAVLTVVGRLPRQVYLALAVLIVCFNFRINVVPVLDTTEFHKYVLMCFMIVVASATFFLKKGTSFAMAFSLCLLLQGAASMSSAHATVSDDRIPHSATSTVQKPDIYLLGFDAMVDEQVFTQYFESTTPWRPFLIGERFRSIEDVQSPGHTTLTTFHKILSVSDSSTKVAGFFNTDFAALRQARALGYRTQFLFHNNHFGRGRSAHWDYNYPSKSVGICPFVPANFGFYLCHRAVENSIENWLGIDDRLLNYKQQLISRIRSAGHDETSWLTVAHTWLPGHTPSDYRHDNADVRDAFRAEYRSRSVEAVSFMKDFVGTIKAFDRDAVIVVFGDHGAVLSRSWENDGGIKAMFTEREVLSDRRAVSMYVYPSDFCRQTIENGYALHKLIGDIFSCRERGDSNRREHKAQRD